MPPPQSPHVTELDNLTTSHVPADLKSAVAGLGLDVDAELGATSKSPRLRLEVNGVGLPATNGGWDPLEDALAGLRVRLLADLLRFSVRKSRNLAKIPFWADLIFRNSRHLGS